MKKILCIDGGGVRGLIPAMILAEIERQCDRPVAKLFDLIAGTSSGGLTATALACPGSNGFPAHRADNAVRLFRERSKEIFRRSVWKGVASVAGLADERYSHAALEAILAEYLGDATMGQALTRVMLTSYDIERRTPFVIKSWETSYAGLAMRHAARATCAAPTYFEPALLHVEGVKRVLIDGGICLPNPAVCAYSEAMRLFGPDLSLLVVSIGVGASTRPIRYEEARNWGLAQWALPILSVVSDGMATAADTQMRQLLGNKYYRFQIPLHLASDDIDNASAANVRALEQQAIELIENQRTEIEDVCALL
ncbi:MAG: patatin-like phospholipase family protein [Myxococcota bacterium]|jgi:hypothetical protein|nr:patatin-like phospholipase family protein [Myxococcota bacterium]